MENNLAFVGTLKNISKIPNADKILQADVYLKDVKITQVVVGLETKEDTKVVYFDSNLCLNQKLIDDYPELAKYLGKGFRVKTIKLKGIISNGLCVEIEKFVKYFKTEKEAIKTLEEGYAFNKIGEQEICKKYIPVLNLPSQGNGKKKGKGKISSRMIANQFNFHFDTSHLMKNIHKIKPDDLISISDKHHGTSLIVSKCLVKKKLNLFESLLKKIKVNVVDTKYDYIYASRRVIKNGEFPGSKHYYKEDIWTDAGKFFEGKLHDGETIYAEIVGYLKDGKMIQKGYDYGCEPTKHKIEVYRITYTSPDGNVLEYSWEAMKQRCQQIGVDHVREFYFGKAKFLFPEINESENWNVTFLEKLRKTYLEKDCDVCKNKVPNEGIVLRVEGLEIESFKLKSERFILRESELKDKEGEESVDIEDVN